MSFKMNLLFVFVIFSVFRMVYLRSLENETTSVRYEDELLALRLRGIRPPDCDLMYDHGEFCSLRAHFFQLHEDRYWYNRETGTCHIFQYGGCKGNRNNFQDLVECTYICSEYFTFKKTEE